MELKKYKLGDLIDVTRGQSLSGEYYATEGKYIRLTCGNFDYNNNSFKENTSKDNLFFTGTIKPEFIMKKGDIITPLTEQAIGLLGSTAMIPESDKYIQSQDVAKIICKENKLDHDFAYYLISSKLVKEQLSAAAQQTKIRHTSPDKIKDCTVWIPDIVVQRRIASVLSALDRKISLNRSINAELERMAKEIYDYWFVQFEFPDANGRPYKSSGGAMVYNPVLKREVPAGWEVKRLSSVCDIFNGATPSTKDESNYGGDIIWITPKDLSDQKSKFTFHGERNITQKGFSSCSTHMLPKGTILMSSRAPIGLVSIASNELCTNQGFKNLVPKEIIDNAYLYYYIKMHIKQIEQLGTGTTFKEVSREDLVKFPILYISNRNLYKKWYSFVKPIFDKQAMLCQEIEELTNQRDELLPLLMTGQVEVI